MTQIALDAPCPCASGKNYVQCCGHLDPRIWDEHAHGRMPGNLADPQWAHVVAGQPVCEYEGQRLPPGVLLKNLGDSYDWQSFASFVAAQSDTRVARTDEKGVLKKSVWRETEIVDPRNRKDDVLQLVRTLFRDEAEPFYGRRLRSLETPHILRYSEGSYYRPHADSDKLNLETQRWEKVMDRDLSLLLYLDEKYSGGEIAFPNFEFRIRPKAGTLLIFPSDCRYLHGVLPVTRGIRHTIVSWCALETAAA